MIGTTLGHFQIQAKIGEGGMGAVYRARDLKLGRTVAVKVLPAGATASPERKARFIQEAKAASSLQHPNIVTIFEIGTQDGVDFMAMEHIDGKMLSALIPSGGMPAKRLLSLALQVAEGLVKAHEARIVHRDLKPSNIMVSSAGLVKILDFGLAKLSQTEVPSADAPTVTGVETRHGAVLGTVAYMSPEQAEGRKLDARSDIFSFGSVLFEMATGRRAFQKDTPTATMASVMRDPVDMKGVPAHLAPIIARCLQKETDKRYQTMSDVRAALLLAGDTSAATTPRGRFRWPAMAAAAVAVVLVALALGAGVGWRWLKPSRPLPPMKIIPLTTDAGFESGPTFSPDGNQVAYVAMDAARRASHLMVKFVDGPTALQLTTTPGVAGSPAWSPDGRQIAYLAVRDNQPAIYLVSPLGGPERKLLEGALAPQLSWSADGRFLSAAERYTETDRTPGSGSIVLIPVDGGQPRVLLRPRRDEWFKDPDFHPTARRLAFSACEGPVGAARCRAMVAGLGSDWSVEGEPVPVTPVTLFISDVRWTASGESLLYTVTLSVSNYIWRADLDGSDPVRLEPAGSGASLPAVSRAGNRAAFTRSKRDFDIWKMDDRGATTRLIGSSLADMSPRFSPDGSRLAYCTVRGEAVEIWLANPDGSAPMPLTNGPGLHQGTPTWSPDGKWIAFDSQDTATSEFQVWVVESTGGTPRQLTRRPKGAHVPHWSRDGKSIYFNATVNGRREILRIPAGGGPEVQMTHDGGYVAQESPDGKTLYYTKGSGPTPLFAMPAAGGAERTVVDSLVYNRAFQVFPDGVYYVSFNDRAYDVRYHEFASGKSRSIGTFSGGMHLYLAVSPDRRSILYSHSPQVDTDLMLIENFR